MSGKLSQKTIYPPWPTLPGLPLYWIVSRFYCTCAEWFKICIQFKNVSIFCIEAKNTTFVLYSPLDLIPIICLGTCSSFFFFLELVIFERIADTPCIPYFIFFCLLCTKFLTLLLINPKNIIDSNFYSNQIQVFFEAPS